ncbi:hypothetical protein ACFL1E_01015 [Candidatus Omnitrophota bacterium]
MNIFAGILLLAISVLLIFLPTMIDTFKNPSITWNAALFISIFGVVLMSLVSVTVGLCLILGIFTIDFFA